MINPISLVFAIFFYPITETIQVPLDHTNPESREIAITYHFENQFDSSRQTIFTIDDPIDKAYQDFEFDNSLKSDFNWVRISGRHFSDDLQDFLVENAEGNWGKIYDLLNQNQVAKDIELIRNQILGDGKVTLVGYSSSSSSLLHYLSNYPNNVKKMICINPLLLDIQSNLSFWSLSENFKNHSTVLSDAEFFDYAYHSTTDYFNKLESKRDSLISNSLKEFKNQKSDPNLYSNNFPMSFAVRSFEHTVGLDEKAYSSEPISNFLREKSEPIWISYLERNFSTMGINYDVGLGFKGEVMIIGAAYNLLINPRVADVLAEFFPKSALIMLRDGHSLKKIREAKDFSYLLLAFLKNDFESKVKAYQNLADLNLLFLNKNYN